MLLLKCFLTLMFIISITNAHTYSTHSQKVLLSDVHTITLYRDKYTNGRRVAPVKQIKCVGGRAKQKYFPEIIQCYNKGSDGIDVQWKCEDANMLNLYRFGRILVTCEGYDYPDDPYILKGSCGLEYELEYRGDGHESEFSHKKYGRTLDGNQFYGIYGHENSTSSWIYALCIAVLIVFVFKYCFNFNRNSNNLGNFGNRNNNNLNPNAEGQQQFQSSTNHSNSDNQPLGSNRQANFFTGLTTGGLLTYFLGRDRRSYNRYNSWNRQSRNRLQDDDYDSYNSRYDEPRTNTFFSQPRYSSSTSSSSTYKAKGFGGTKRR